MADNIVLANDYMDLFYLSDRYAYVTVASQCA
jgi:hypothetical protein